MFNNDLLTMKNSKMSLFFVFAVTALISISYLPVNAEKMEESAEQMKTMINELEKGSVHSPNKQMSMGINAEDVVCNAGYDLVMRSSGKAACCTSSTAMKLESRGLGTIEKTDAMMEKERGEMMMDAKELMAQAAETTTSASEEMMDESGDSMMKMGEFVGLAGHSGEGIAKIIDVQDGASYLRFEDFTVTNGPDLFVYIAQDGDVKNGINLGKLKGSSGNQNYELPENTDLEVYNTAVVYCKLFGVYFAEATLK